MKPLKEADAVAIIQRASERPEDRVVKTKELPGGRWLVWTQFHPEPGRHYTRWQLLIRETVALIETKATLLDRRSVDVLKDLEAWKKRGEGRWVVLYYPRDQSELLCGLLPQATQMPGKDHIVEYDPTGGEGNTM